jgi:hypothetical protein
MDNLKLSQFVDLLEAQAAGDESAIDRIRELDPSVNDGICAYNLYQQWTSAFSFPGGRIDALQPILSLARSVQAGSDNAVAMFMRPEWAQLVALRGPVEGVWFRKCSKCGHTFPKMASSGFYDAGGLVCPGCGNVYFKCVYDETPTPPCACGSTYPEPGEPGCPKCGSMDLTDAGTQSGYEYFKSHTFIRGPDA